MKLSNPKKLRRLAWKKRKKLLLQTRKILQTWEEFQKVDRQREVMALEIQRCLKERDFLALQMVLDEDWDRLMDGSLFLKSQLDNVIRSGVSDA